MTRDDATDEKGQRMAGRRTAREIHQALRESDGFIALAGGLGVLTNAPTSAPFGADVDPVFGPAASRALSRARLGASSETAKDLADRNDAAIAAGQRAARVARERFDDRAAVAAALSSDVETADDEPDGDAVDVEIDDDEWPALEIDEGSLVPDEVDLSAYFVGMDDEE